MTAVGALQICNIETNIPSYLRSIGEILIGGAIGLGFTRTFLISFRQLLLPSFIIMISVIIFGVIVGYYCSNQLIWI
jgi:uncharacterized membrane protein AbrB (regulator of aidB expression)